jgi:hypothetical protein
MKKALLSLLVLPCFLLLIALLVACHAQNVIMPTAPLSLSPDSRWQVRWVPDETQNIGEMYSLALSRVGGKSEVVVYEFDRCCEIVWSADSQRFAINDWHGSSSSVVWFVEVSTPKTHRLVISNLLAIVGGDEVAGHCYYEALKWESTNRLSIQIFGHTDENPSHGFCYYLSVDTQSGLATLVRKEKAY